MRRSSLPLALLTIACGLACLPSTMAWGQLPASQLTSLFPLGGKQGSTVDVSIAGNNLEGPERLVFSHPGITGVTKKTPHEFLGEQVVPNQFDVTIAADVPPGIYDAWFVGRYGVSNPRSFVVGVLEELRDGGQNRTRETAQELAVGSVVNGTADANLTDWYKVPVKTGQRLLVTCATQRLDSRMTPAVRLYSPDGAEVVTRLAAPGTDPTIDVSATMDGDYLIELHDLVYAGGADYGYRLSVHTGALVEFLLPAAGQPGSTASYDAYGRNLPGGKPSGVRGADGAELQVAAVQIPVPAEHDGHHEVAGYSPTASQLLPTIAFRSPELGQLRLDVAQAPVLRETDQPNDVASAAQVVPVPCDLTGQFLPDRDQDWYQFEAKQGEVLSIEVFAHRRGLPIDASLLIQRVEKNEQGEEKIQEVAYVDDPGDRNGRVGGDFDITTDDPSYRLAVPADGVYRVLVEDLYGDARTDPRMVYRLVIRPEAPDFRVSVFVKQNKVANANQVLFYSPVLRQGGTLSLDVEVTRLGGYDGEIEVTAEGLPNGVRCLPTMLAGPTNTSTLVLVADDGAAAWQGPIRIVGRAKLGEQQLVRGATASTTVWETANRQQQAPEFRVQRELLLSVIGEQEPALLQVGDGAPIETSLGGAIELPIKVTRRGEFAEALKLQAAGLPAEVKPGDVDIKPGEDGKLAWTIANANAKPGTYTFVLRSDTKLKYAQYPERVEQAQQAQTKLDEIVKQTAEEVKAKTTTQADATKAATEAKAKADAAVKARDAAKAAADAKPDDAALKEQLAAAEKEVVASQDAQKAADEAKTQADAQLKEAQDRAKRATDAKAAADKALADAQKAAAAKDVNFALVSTPIVLRLVATPMGLTLPEKVELAAGQKAMLAVKVERKYGFNEPIDVTLTLPNGVGGVTLGKLRLEAGQSEGEIELTANDKPTAGDHAVKVECKGAFNKVNVVSTGSVTLHIPAPAP